MNYLNKLITVLGYEFIPNRCINKPGPHHLRDVRTGEWIEWPMTPEQKLKKVNARIERLIEEYLEAKENIERCAQLTLLYHNSQRKLTMSNQTPAVDKKVYSKVLNAFDQPVVYSDSVVNNPELIDKDYDITIDEATGEVMLVSNHDKTGGMIQGCISGFVKRNQDPPVPGSLFDYMFDGKKPSQPSDAGLRRARFSGSIYFENLPVDVFSSKQQKLPLEPKEEVKPKEKTNETKESQQSGPEETNSYTYPSKAELRKIKKGQLKPQSGLSRTERSKWWQGLRELYPENFDARGNWIGFGATTSDSNVNNNPPARTDDGSKDEVKKEFKSVNALGLMGETGMGNAITKMTDEKIPNGFMLARHFEGKGYAIASTPAKDGQFDKSAFIICNKERTAKFMLAGLSRNKSFSTRVDGMEVVRTTELKQKYFEDDTLYAYWVTNAVTALESLGTQSRDIEDIKAKAGS